MKTLVGNQKIIALILLTVFLIFGIQATSHGFFGGIIDAIGDIAGAVGDAVGAVGEAVGIIVNVVADTAKIAAEVVGLSIRIVALVIWHTDSLVSIEPFPNGGIIGVVISNLIHLWDPLTEQTTATLKHNAAIKNIAISPDGLVLASASTDGTIQLWNPTTETLQNTLRGHTDSVLDVAFSPDGLVLASASTDGTVRLWDPHLETLEATLSGHTDSVLDVVFSPDGLVLASASTDGTVRLWDPHLETLEATLSGHTDSVLDVVFSPDGLLLASASTDGTVRLWDPHSEDPKATFNHKSPVLSIAFSPDGEILATGSEDGTARLWNLHPDPHTAKVAATLGHESPVRSVAFSPDGSTLFSGSADGNMRLWEITIETETGKIEVTDATTATETGKIEATADESPQYPQIESAVSISEIMYGSEGTHSPPQWIEINNAGSKPINMTGWKLIFRNVDRQDLIDGPLNGTIVFEDEFWGDAPRIWPNDILLIVVDDDVNSGGFMDDQIFSLRWRGGLDISFWDTFLSSNGFLIQLIDKDSNVVDEVGNYDGNTKLWDLPYNFNKGRTRAGNRTSMIRRYVDGQPLDGTQAASWVSAADANLTEDQLTYYGDENDISTPGIGIVINEISAQFVEYDVNQDGVVDISDLVMVAGRLGQSGPNVADVNRDGVVNVNDLILVAGAITQPQAAPSLHPTSLEMFTAADIRGWLTQAQGLTLTDPKLQSGIRFLEQLLSVLVPKETALLPNYPNPFNPETWIPYRLAEDAEVTLTIYAIDGQVVRRLALGHQPAGMYQNRSRAAYWNGRNAFGEPVASGVYFYTITAGDFSATRKMLIRK